ncbi:MAG: hypothetical protein MJA27_31235 [Pseudanabaenales cyanobacterium]|nr:hypothetical protein [Pseudanabaenales cyanobacterium]
MSSVDTPLHNAGNSLIGNSRGLGGSESSREQRFEKLCPRQPQESAKAYAACQDYCFMGTQRSLDKLVTLYLENRPQPNGLKRSKNGLVVDMYKLASELDEQVYRSGSDEIDALRVLAEAGWAPDEVFDEAAEALDEIGSRIKQGLQENIHSFG